MADCAKQLDRIRRAERRARRAIREASSQARRCADDRCRDGMSKRVKAAKMALDAPAKERAEVEYSCFKKPRD